MIVIIMPHFYSVNRFQITGTNKERTSNRPYSTKLLGNTLTRGGANIIIIGQADGSKR